LVEKSDDAAVLYRREKRGATYYLEK